MADNIDNLILEHLRALRQGQDTIQHELRELQARISGLESTVISSRRDGIHLQEETARQQSSIDAIKERLQRIEKRLELHDPL
ncbi:MAG: hypothetical protein AAF512_02160 [Pseudomonadota bacterium]